MREAGPTLKRITLVLGSGGARGLSFVGALKALQGNSLLPSRIIGTSIGALIGAAYCAGTDVQELERFACGLRMRHFISLMPGRSGLLSNRKLVRLCKRIVPAVTFEDLKTPLTVVCTDLQQGASVRYDSGDLLSPLVGSCTLAGLFEPMSHEGRYLVDGGYTDPLPVANADPDSVVVVVDPMVRPDWRIPFPAGARYWPFPPLKLAALQGLKSLDSTLYWLSQERLRQRRIVHVIPELGDMRAMDFKRGDWAVRAGEEALRNKLPEIQSALNS